MRKLPTNNALQRAREDLVHQGKLLSLGGGLDHSRLRMLADNVGAAKKTARNPAQARRLEAAHAKLVELAGLDDADISDFTILGNLLRDD